MLYQHAIYQRLDYSDGYMPGTLPTNTNYFVLILPAPALIGVNERVLYNGNTLTLTYALNRCFNTVFRQPVSYLGQMPLSDIYIINFDSQYQSFIVGAAETDSSAVAANISSGYVLNALTNDPLADFSINIPTAVFAAITGGEKTVRAFADKYIISGINYTVHTY